MAGVESPFFLKLPCLNADACSPSTSAKMLPRYIVLGVMGIADSFCLTFHFQFGIKYSLHGRRRGSQCISPVRGFSWSQKDDGFCGGRLECPFNVNGDFLGSGGLGRVFHTASLVASWSMSF